MRTKPVTDTGFSSSFLSKIEISDAQKNPEMNENDNSLHRFLIATVFSRSNLKVYNLLKQAYE